MHELTKERVSTLMSEHQGVERSELTDDAWLADMMDELDLIELFKEASRIGRNEPQNITLGKFLDILDQYLP